METKVIGFPVAVQNPIRRTVRLRRVASMPLVSTETAQTLRVIEAWHVAASTRKKIANELSKRALRSLLA